MHASAWIFTISYKPLLVLFFILMREATNENIIRRFDKTMKTARSAQATKPLLRDQYICGITSDRKGAVLLDPKKL
jgi:hypothetical protein